VSGLWCCKDCVHGLGEKAKGEGKGKGRIGLQGAMVVLCK
jgi:hypothetical protein